MSSGYDIISSLFSPLIAVYTSPDVESICLKNNLNFVELIKPFCKLSKDVLLKDANNIPHTVKDLHVIFQYVNSFIPTSVEINRLLHEVVEKEWVQPQSQSFTNSEVSALLPVHTPWYDTYMHVFLATQVASEHEFVRHCVGCAFIVSTRHPDPVDQLAKFTQQQNQLQMHSSGFGSSGNLISGAHAASTAYSSAHPRWFQHNIMKFYVLLNDIVDGRDVAEVERIYAAMKSTYGSGHCHLLNINSRPPPSSSDALQAFCDPWQQFLLPIGTSLLKLSTPHSTHVFNHNSQITATQHQQHRPTFTVSGNEDSPYGEELGLSSDAGAMAGVLGPSSEVDSHPLAFSKEEDILEDRAYNMPASKLTGNNFRSYNPVITNGGLPLAADAFLSPSGAPGTMNLFHASPCYSLVPVSVGELMRTPHGICLTEDDMERLRVFVYDLVVKALIPWVEKTMKSLHDQVANRTRISRSIFSATKRIFGVGGGGGSAVASGTNSAPLTAVVTSSGTVPNRGAAPPTGLSPSSSVASIASAGQEAAGSLLSGLSGYLPTAMGGGGYGTNAASEGMHTVHSAAGSLAYLTSSGVPGELPNTGSVATGLTSSVVYSQDAAEMQLRRYADLALLFQQYDLAHQTYGLLKKDFQQESAWLHYAGAMEGSALSTYLQGVSSQRPYPHHPWEQAVSHYLHCKNVSFATRATMLHTEALKSRALMAEAVLQYTKLTTEDNDLRSALLLEQAARCHARLRVPQLRKYAFHLVMAAHRFSKCGQKQHSIRCYSQAHQVYLCRRWRFIDDHIYRAIASQSTALRQLREALFHYQELLTGPLFQVGGDRLTDALIANEKLHSMELLQHQTPEMQAAVVRDLVIIYKQYLTSVIGDMRRLVDGALPQIRLPLVRPSHAIKVMLGRPLREDGNTAPLDRCDVTDLFSPEWRRLHKRLLKGMSVVVSVAPPPPCMSDKTDNSLAKPKTVVRESIFVLVPLENPLQVPLLLVNVSLLWRMEISSSSSSSTSEQSTTIVTNECELDDLVATAEVCHTEVLPECYLQPCERKVLTLSLYPKQLGTLHILGLSYQFCNYVPQSLMMMSGSPSLVMSSSTSSLLSAASTTTAQFSDEGVASARLSNAASPPPTDRVTIQLGDVCDTDSLFSANGSISTEASMRPLSAGGELSNYPGNRSVPLTTSYASQPSPSHTSVPAVPSTSTGAGASIWCKLPLQVRGRRLHLTKKQRAAQVYAEDFRLHLHVVAPMPLLKVTFSEMPSQLLKGEVRQIRMRVLNIGAQPLTTLRVAVNCPTAVTFGLQPHELSHCSTSPAAAVAESGTLHHPASTSVSTLSTELFYSSKRPWIDLSLVDGSLMPGASQVITFWLRGYSCTSEGGNTSATISSSALSDARNKTGVVNKKQDANLPQSAEEILNLKMLFYYEGASTSQENDKSALNYRLLRYHTVIRLQPALQLQVLAMRQRSGEPESIFLQLQARNVCPMSNSGEANPTRELLQVLQVTSASSLWLLSPMKTCETFIPTGLILAPQESVNLYFRAQSLPLSDNPVESSSSVVYLSDVVFHEGGGTVSSVSPCADFYLRSNVPWINRQHPTLSNRDEVLQQKPPDSDEEDDDLKERSDLEDSRIGSGPGEAFRVQLTLIVLWKLKRYFPFTTSEDALELLGQCHVHIPVLEHTVHYPLLPSLTSANPVRPVVFQPVTEADPRVHLQPLIMQSKMISLFLHHPSQVDHDFTTHALLLVPMQVKLYNASSLATLVRIEASGLDARHRRTALAASQSLAVAAATLGGNPLTVEPVSGNPSTTAVNSLSSLVGPLRSTAQFSWVGPCQRQLLLQPRESQSLTFTACFPRPGTYELLQLEVKAALAPLGLSPGEARVSHDQLTFVKQESVFPSLIIVHQAP